jgi:hypothetical protein
MGVRGDAWIARREARVRLRIGEDWTSPAATTRSTSASSSATGSTPTTTTPAPTRCGVRELGRQGPRAAAAAVGRWRPIDGRGHRRHPDEGPLDAPASRTGVRARTARRRRRGRWCRRRLATRAPDCWRASADPRVRASTSRPAAASLARANRGIEEARAPLVAFLDDDDLWAPDHLRRVSTPCPPRSFAFRPALRRRPSTELLRPRIDPPPSGCSRQIVARNPVVTPSAVVADARRLRQVGGFDPALLDRRRLRTCGVALRCHRAGSACPAS